MPIRRRQLSRGEQEEHFEIAQRLRADGVSIELPEQKQSKVFEFFLKQPDSRLYVLPNGQPLYALQLGIICWCPNLVLEQFEIVPHWADDVFAWSAAKGVCRFRGELDFTNEE